MAYQLRFLLDWRLLGYEDKSFWENRSNSKKNQFSDTVMETNNEYIKNTFIPSFKSEIEARLKISLSVEFSETPIPSVIINYPKAHETGYIKPQIQLEIGPIAEWVPNAKKSISSFAAQQYPEFFKKTTSEVKIMIFSHFRINGSIWLM